MVYFTQKTNLYRNRIIICNFRRKTIKMQFLVLIVGTISEFNLWKIQRVYSIAKQYYRVGKSIYQLIMCLVILCIRSH
jgi:DNA-binding transcriptional regulator/RsmH inhibitor MraZ